MDGVTRNTVTIDSELSPKEVVYATREERNGDNPPVGERDVLIKGDGRMKSCGGRQMRRRPWPREGLAGERVIGEA